MKNYKFKAEAWPDVCRFMAGIAKMCFQFEYVDGSVPCPCVVVVEIRCEASLAELVDIANGCVDCHRIAETLAEPETFDARFSEAMT